MKTCIVLAGALLLVACGNLKIANFGEDSGGEVYGGALKGRKTAEVPNTSGATTAETTGGTTGGTSGSTTGDTGGTSGGTTGTVCGPTYSDGSWRDGCGMQEVVSIQAKGCGYIVDSNRYYGTLENPHPDEAYKALVDKCRAIDNEDARYLCIINDLGGCTYYYWENGGSGVIIPPTTGSGTIGL